MRFVAEHLDKLADRIKGKKVKIDAMTHMIVITCDKELAKDLIDADLTVDPEDPAVSEMCI